MVYHRLLNLVLFPAPQPPTYDDSGAVVDSMEGLMWVPWKKPTKQKEKGVRFCSFECNYQILPTPSP
jgi:hypothetical protein